MDLQELIEKAAEAQGSLKQLAASMGKHQNRLTEWKKGTHKPDADEIAYQLAQAYSRKLDEMQEYIEHLQRIGTFGAANDPLCGMQSPRLRPARTLKPRQNPQAEPVMSCASVRARHLETAPA